MRKLLFTLVLLASVSLYANSPQNVIVCKDVREKLDRFIEQYGKTRPYVEMFIAERSNGFFIAFYASESYIPPSANLTLHENYVDYTELGEVEYGNVRLSVAAILDKDSDSIDKIINRNLF